MVVVLVGVALITGGILAYVNDVTAGPISVQAKKSLADGIKAVMGGVDLTVSKEDTIRQNISGKEVTFVVHETFTTGGFGGDLKVLVGFNNDGEILGYTILQHSETPGLGAKADKWFQKDGKGSVIGRNPGEAPLTVNKDGGDIDAITASTITSRAFLLAVNQAYQAYKSLPVDANTGATSSHSK